MSLNILRFAAVKARVGYSRAQTDRLEADGKFPRRIRLGPAAVGWLETEIDAWIKDRIAERDGKAA